MEERRLLLAVALSFLVLMGYRILFPPPPRPVPAPGPPPTVQSQQAEPAEAPRPAPPEPQPAATPEPTSRSLPTLADTTERRVEIETPDIAVAFTNRGARLLSWSLKHYLTKRGDPEEMVRLVPGGQRPLDIDTGDPTVNAQLEEALFVPSSERLVVNAGREAQLRFEYAEAELRAEKVFRFHPSGYVVEIEVTVEQAGRALPVSVGWGPGLGNPSEEEKDVFGYQEPRAVLFSRGAVERVALDDLESAQAVREVAWAGVEAMYFTALWMPDNGQGTAEMRAAPMGTAGAGEPPQQGPVVGLQLGGSPALLFVGPKDYHILSPLGRELARVVPVGDWIGPVVVPLLGLLRWVYEFVGNYGWSIVVLTLLINLAMAPLRHYSIANGIKMAKLSPEMKVIQERYRKVPALDPKRQEMQKEVAALYARHGMSMSTQMAVGCLPLLLTMPFLIAFYRVLMVSIDLRGAAFLWIPDLSQKDPLYITPILMGVSMLAMQKMTPTTMDPAQQRIMLIMPLVLVVMFFAAPAGLNLYWLASNACSIIQQGITLKVLRDREAPAIAKKERKRNR